MKKYRNKSRIAFVAALFAGAAFINAAYAADDNKMQEKINLMVSAVQAREAGDLQNAKQQLEKLIAIAPEDAGVQRMLNDVNADIERLQKGEKAVLANNEKLEAKKAAEEAKVAKAKADADAKKAAAEAKVAADAKAKADAIVKVAEEKQDVVAEAAAKLVAEAYDLIDEGDWQKAEEKLALADAKLNTVVSVTNSEQYSFKLKTVRADWNQAKATIARERAEVAMAERKPIQAKEFAAEYAKFEADKEEADDFVAKVDKFEKNPYNHSLDDASPAYSERKKKVEIELRRGKLQYMYGDYAGARTTFRNIEAIDATNVEAKAYQRLIAEKLQTNGKLSYLATRDTMLSEVDTAWSRPQVFSGKNTNAVEDKRSSEVDQKLKDIVIANFDIPEPGLTLAQALKTLSLLSEENDKSTSARKGVNIILFDEASQPENVNISLRGEALGQILDILARKYGYTYDVENEKVIVRKGTDQTSASMDTIDFPVAQATVTRMVGLKKSAGGNDPFGGGDSGGEMSPEEQGVKIKEFLTKAGVEFGTGSNIAFDGTKLWVTNTARNLDKVRNILLKYTEVKQVEIEAKFLEVQQGDLNELAFNWRSGAALRSLSNGLSTVIGDYNYTGGQYAGTQTIFATTDGKTRNNRTLLDAFPKSASSQPISITGPNSATVEQVYPTLNSAMNVGKNSVPTSSALIGVVSGGTIEVLINALEQKTGSDLLCAPKVTVLSGTEAKITVSQQMYYAESWGDMQAQVSEAGSGSTTVSTTNPLGGGAPNASIAITPGTPQDFKTYDVGVTMVVTPNVEEDGSINLTLNPRVSDFEGFMSYGGNAVGVVGYTTVTVPAGFIMPVFSVREVSTSVTIFDGATVVLGGLTREEVITVNDSVPILGDIPLIGRLFKSKGESRQKRNLMIFVTANRISPGGSVTREQFADMRPGSVYQNPTIVSPGGAVQRLSEEVLPTEIK